MTSIELDPAAPGALERRGIRNRPECTVDDEIPVVRDVGIHAGFPERRLAAEVAEPSHGGLPAENMDLHGDGGSLSKILDDLRGVDDHDEPPILYIAWRIRVMPCVHDARDALPLYGLVGILHDSSDTSDRLEDIHTGSTMEFSL